MYIFGNIFLKSAENPKLHSELCSYISTGLPDFSWHNIPKREKYTKCPQNIPNGHKIFPMAVK
jgi:hypothetical protein